MNTPLNKMPEVFPDVYEWGEDIYGLWQTLLFNHVPYRFRWIAPTTFMMGSPEDEAKREPWGKETQHQVTLSQGYWLGETTVTQALWQAVMNDNPSRFDKNPQNPVERVSWNQCDEYIRQLNQQYPDLALRFPTEAEWENACRAGTQTPFSFGENISPEQVNYNGDYPYKNAPKGEYREETVAVKSLPCNDWGLYEMHGNVWEWCSDWWQGDLGKQAISNPQGAAEGAGRVVRGGSWFDFGGYVRSAFRYRFSPVNAYDSGLRLALGQSSQQPAGLSPRVTSGRTVSSD